MKRILFYLIILLQVIVIVFLTYQFEKIDRTGYEIKIQTLSPEFPVYGDFIDGDMYVEYDINKIQADRWKTPIPIDYNTPVYVLLEKDKTGVFRVRHAATEKIETTKEDAYVLKGTYQYYDQDHDIHYVDYGLEHIKQADRFGTFKPRDELVITILIGKWGQYKVVGIDKWNE